MGKHNHIRVITVIRGVIAPFDTFVWFVFPKGMHYANGDDSTPLANRLPE